jgi:hypothetical protein
MDQDARRALGAPRGFESLRDSAEADHLADAGERLEATVS